MTKVCTWTCDYCRKKSTTAQGWWFLPLIPLQQFTQYQQDSTKDFCSPECLAAWKEKNQLNLNDSGGDYATR